MYRSVFVYHPVQCVPKNVSGCITMYRKCILVVLHNVNTRASDTHHKYAVIRQQYMYSLSSCMSCADKNPIRAQYVRYIGNFVGRCSTN